MKFAWNRWRTQALAVIAAVVVLDRITKRWIEANVGPLDVRPVIENVFNIVHTKNRGAAFGMFNDSSNEVRMLLLVVVSLGILGLILHMLWQATSNEAPGRSVTRWALALVGGGAIGNLWDRIASGMVTDFLQVFLGAYEWPSFNVADSAISIGAVLLAAEIVFERKSHVSETPSSR